jgi:hypothetical protein
MLLAFRKHAEKYGKEAQGLLFRRSFPETGELIKLGQYVFVQEGWEWKVGERKWVSPSGAVLQLKHLDEDSDAMKLQGFSVTFLGFDELGNWPSPNLLICLGLLCVQLPAYRFYSELLPTQVVQGITGLKKDILITTMGNQYLSHLRSKITLL